MILSLFRNQVFPLNDQTGTDRHGAITVHDPYLPFNQTSGHRKGLRPMPKLESGNKGEDRVREELQALRDRMSEALEIVDRLLDDTDK